MSVVISKSLAVRIFGTDQDVVGKVIEINHDKAFNVTGVMEDIKPNSSNRFDFVLSFEMFKTENEWVLEWGNNGPSCYAVLQEGTDPVAFSAKVKDYIKGKDKDSNVNLFATKFSDRYLFGNWENGVQSGGRIEYVNLFSIVAVLVLVIACINFMNLSTARATRKSKEVGIKKSVGAGRESLIIQFMGESLVTALLAFLLSIGIVFIFLPTFNVITDKVLTLDLTDPTLLLWSFGTTVVTGLLAGSYPALYLSGFKPAAVLKGEVRGSIGELWARKGLVVVQFSLSVWLIVSVIVIYKQIEYVQTQSLGYVKENLIQFPREGKLQPNLETFLTEVRRIPGVKSAASIGHGLLGQNSNTSGLQWEGKNPEDRILFENASANYGTLETMGVEFVAGRGFIDGQAADSTKIVFNEAAIKVMNMEDPIGKHIKLWDQYDLEIIGVVKDFHFQSMHDAIKPLFFRLKPANTYNILVRLEGGARQKEALDQLTTFYADFNPGFTLEYKFQDVEYARLYAAEQRVATLCGYFAGMAIVISCLGLFGLAAFTAERRLKEIGIRKALGSSSTSIVLLLSKDFTVMVLISVIFGLTLGYFVLDSWLEKFAFRVPLSLLYFATSGAIALGISWLTVASQAIRASRVNPVQCLRSE
jgi:predicted permease